MTELEERLRVDLHASADIPVSDRDVEQAWRRVRAHVAVPDRGVRTRVLVAAAAAAVLAVTAGLVWWQLLRGNEATLPVSPLPGSTSVPFCTTDPDEPGGEVIVGAGAPIKIRCKTGLWHHATSTILVADRNYRVADGSLTPLGKAPGRAPAMSHDGRYAAWRLLDCVTRFPVGPDFGPWLYVFEVATAREVVSRATIPTSGRLIGPCSQARVQGIDDLGRVYVELHDHEPEAHDVQMYDIRTGEWTNVDGIPAGTGDITYVTVDGFAVSTEPGVGDSSVEGVVDDHGRFEPQREVPVGQGLWSPDRSFVVVQDRDGVAVRRADDLSNRVVLDLAVDQARSTTEAFTWHTQWESPTSVLVQGFPVGADGDRFYRCDARSGTCKVKHRTGMMALANNVREPAE